MSEPDFEDIGYEPEDTNDKNPSDDANTCLRYCCRFPFTFLAIIGMLFVGIPTLIVSNNILYRVMGTLIPLAIIGVLVYRYNHQKTP